VLTADRQWSKLDLTHPGALAAVKELNALIIAEFN
jgi:hypothetical protein